MLQSLVFVEGVILAMLGLGVVDTAIIFLLLGIFPQPGAPGHIFVSDRVNPNIIPTVLAIVVKNIHPLQNIFSVLKPPTGYILRVSGSGKSIQMKAASSALFAYKSGWWGQVQSSLSRATANLAKRI
jgi:hypothetical protein